MGFFGASNWKSFLLGLRSRVTRRIFKQVALIGGVVAILVAASQAFLAYENSLASTKSHIETIGHLVGPPIDKEPVGIRHSGYRGAARWADEFDRNHGNPSQPTRST